MSDMNDVVEQLIMYSFSAVAILIPFAIAILALRLWRATAIKGSVEITVAAAFSGVLQIVGVAVNSQMVRIIENNSIPDWLPVYSWVLTCLILSVRLLAVVGFVRLVTHLIATFPRATQPGAAR